MSASTKMACTYICLQIIYALVSMILAILGFCYLYADMNILVDDIVANWQSKTIMDIQASPYECPDGYEYAYNYIWPGTSSGCWCGDVSSSTKDYYEIKSDLSRGYCGYNESLAGCDNVRPTSAELLNVWSTVNETNTVLCVKRSNETWAQVAPQSGGETCPANMTKCGQSLDNAFCTSNPQCPINDIKMSNLTLPRDSDILEQCNATNSCVIMAQYSSSAFIIKYQRGDSFDALPTSQFRLNEYSMCFDTTQDDYTPGIGSFALLWRSKSDCRQQGAPLWNKSAYHITEERLFDLNGLTGAIEYLNKFGYYSEHRSGADYQYNLFSRSYIPWSIPCRDQMETLSDKTSELSRLKTIQLILMILTIIISLVLGILVPCMLLKGTTLIVEEITIGQLIEAICKIIQIPLQIFGFLVASHQVASYRSILDGHCSTTDILVLFNNVKNVISVTYYGNAVNLILSVTILLIGLLFRIPERVRAYKKKLDRPETLNHDSEDQVPQDASVDIDWKNTKEQNHQLQCPLILVNEEKQTAKSVY